MLTKMGAKIIEDPAAARARLLQVFEENKGDRQRTAKTLAADVRTVYRWLNRLDAWDALDTLMDEKGFPRVPGPPRTRDKIVAALVAARGNLPRAATALELPTAELKTKLTELALVARVNAALKASGYPTIELETAS